MEAAGGIAVHGFSQRSEVHLAGLSPNHRSALLLITRDKSTSRQVAGKSVAESWGHLAGWVRDRQFATNPPREEIGDLGVARDGLGVAGLRVLPEGMFLAFSSQHAAVAAKMPEDLALHPITISSCLASGGSARKDSSRLCTRMSAIASRRFARHSSRDLPWPFAPGTSAQYATYHGPSCSTIAVNSLCMTPV